MTTRVINLGIILTAWVAAVALCYFVSQPSAKVRIDRPAYAGDSQDDYDDCVRLDGTPTAHGCWIGPESKKGAAFFRDLCVKSGRGDCK